MSNNTLVSGYQAAAIINALLAEEGIDRVVPPQMIYNYIRNDRIESVEVIENNKTRKMITLDTLKTFYENVILKTSNVQKKSTKTLLSEFKSL